MNLTEDVLLHVFQRTLSSNFSWTKSGPQPSIETIAPFNFSLVCHGWRTLVLGSPVLWSSIVIEDYPYDDRRIAHLCQILAEWLRLSDSNPLKIRLRLRSCGKDLPPHLLHLFIQELHRWKDVDINVAAACPALTSQEDITVVARHTSLSLRFPGSTQPIAVVDLSHLVENSISNLRVLIIDSDARVRVPSQRDALRLPRLCDLTLNIGEKDDIDDTLSIIAASPRLVTLKLTIRSLISPTSTMFDNKFVSMPHLTNFALNSFTPVPTRRLLDHLATPALRTFFFRHSGETVNGDVFDMPNVSSVAVQMPDIVRFFARSRPPLLFLELYYYGYYRKGCVVGWDDDDDDDDDHYKDYIDNDEQKVQAGAIGELLLIVSDTLRKLKCGGPIVDRRLVESLTKFHDSNLQPPPPWNLIFVPPLCPSLILISLTRALSKGDDEEDAQRLGFPSKEQIEEMVASRWDGGRGVLKKVVIDLPLTEGLADKGTHVGSCIEEGLEVWGYDESRLFGMTKLGMSD